MAEGGIGRHEEQAMDQVDMLAWSSVLDRLRQDEVISGWLTEAECTLLASDRLSQLPVWKAILMYQCFDIKRIIRNVIQLRRNYMDTKETERIEIRVRVGHAERAFVYTNKETMSCGIEFLIFLFAERGSTNRKYTSKSLESHS
jgi:hypothetical protein